MPVIYIYIYTVGLQLSEHVGTEGCSDNPNVWIIEH